MKILIFDNYDSFAYNLLHAVHKLGYTDVEVHRNDKIGLDDIQRFDKIILSPGPGLPSEAGIIMEVIKKYAPTKSILGVCLGHQAIAEAFGCTLQNLSEVYHGIATPIHVLENHRIFYDMLSTLTVGRYHSWIVDRQTLPECLKVTATDDDGMIMALCHKTYDVHGVQFHPESIMTPEGNKMLKNWLETN